MPLLPPLLFALAAYAEPTGDSALARCRSLSDLQASVNICDENPAYREAGERCLSELEALVKREQGRNAQQMAAALQQSLEEKGARQSAEFSATGADYTLTRNSLANLLREAHAVRARLDAYRGEVVLPSSWVHAEEIAGGLHAVVWSDPCYAQNAAKLDSALDRADQILGDLQRTAKANQELFQRTGTKETNLESAMAAAPAGGKRGQGGVAPKQRAPSSSSTITGKIPPKRNP